MEPLSHIVLILWMFLSVPLHISLGRVVFWRIEREQDETPLALFYVTGLLTYLVAVLVLLLLQAPWFAVTFAPFLFLLFESKRFHQLFSYPLPHIAPHTALWFVVILCLSLTLFEVHTSLITPWKNNYGDLAFHLGMISSFLWGGGFPAEYHLFPGETLSYPFFINLWSVTYWWLAPTWENLSTIFAFQWCVLWTLLYFSLSGVRYPLLPYALLLGGGSYAVLGSNSGQMIAEGYGWTSFLSTIWVTQRSALLGAAVSAVIVQRFFLWRENELCSRELLLIGLLLGAMPLVHTHIGLVTGLSLLMFVCFDALTEKKIEQVWMYLLGASLSFLFLPLLLGKAGTVSLMSGWTTIASKGWLENCWHVFLSFALLWAVLRAKSHIIFLSLGAIFLLGNFVQLSVWDWDQIKIFLALYLLVLVYWGTRTKQSCWNLHWLLPLIFFPGLYEGYILFRDAKQFTVYDAKALEAAQLLRENTNADDVIAAPSDHNSPVTLTGRPLFFGYEGTLRSHGIDYLSRRKLQKNLSRLAKCQESKTDICPDYIYYPPHQKRKEWRKKDVEANFTPTRVSGLWMRGGQAEADTNE